MPIRAIIFVLSSLLLASCAVQKPGVYAEMFVKSKTPQEGYVPHSAEGKDFYIKPVTEAGFAPGVDSYHAMHHHGVAFENEWMAYRIYFDKKQTIDIYAKRTPGLELDACKWYPTDEQLAAGFGDDILRVSGAIGVGACKPWNGEKMIHFDDVELRTERIVSLTPRQAVCEIVDSAWLAPDGARYNLTTRYTIFAGKRHAMVEVFLSPLHSPQGVQQSTGHSTAHRAFNSPQDVQLPVLCTGVMGVPVGNRDNYLVEKGLVGSWGTAFPVNDTVKYARETVGLGVYVPKAYYAGNVQDKNNNLVLLQLIGGKQTYYARYYLVATGLKENTPAGRTEQQWYAWLRRWSKHLR